MKQIHFKNHSSAFTPSGGIRRPDGETMFLLLKCPREIDIYLSIKNLNQLKRIQIVLCFSVCALHLQCYMYPFNN